MDERAFLQEIANRLNEFVRDFPTEAGEIFGNPRAFGSEVASMLRAVAGANIDMPFGVLFGALMAAGSEDAQFHLSMVWDEYKRFRGFKVIEVAPMSAGEIQTKVRKTLRPSDDDPVLN
jgi:hypothetical protein